MDPQAKAKYDLSGLSSGKKVRLYITVGVLILVVLIGFTFDAVRVWLLGFSILLLAAIGLELEATTSDLESSPQSTSPIELVVDHATSGNLVEQADSRLMNTIWRDKNGNQVAEGTLGAKREGDYNCTDFATQPEAQRFFETTGGVAGDSNRLDGNKDGVACQSLPGGI